MTGLELYSDTILQIAGNPPATPRLAAPHGTGVRVARVCGSRIAVDVCVADGVVVAYGATVSACALGQASAAIVGRHIVGSTADEMRALGAAMAAMLEADGPAPGGKWGELACLVAVRPYRARHASTLLVFEAVAAALEAAGA